MKVSCGPWRPSWASRFRADTLLTVNVERAIVRFLTAFACVLALCSPRVTLADEEESDAYEDEVREEQELDRRRTDDPPEKEPLTAGGLKAPDALPEAKDERSEVEKELETADREDAGRGLEFVWLDAGVGYQYLAPAGFREQEFLPDARWQKGSGLAISGALGLRLLYFSLGARFRYTPLPEFAFYTLGPELGLRIPYGSWEPYVLLGVGYAHLGGAKTELGQKISGVAGLFGRVGGGLDYYFSKTFSIGGQLAFDYLGLRRKAQAELCQSDASCAYASTGRASGYDLTLGLTLGLHF